MGGCADLNQINSIFNMIGTPKQTEIDDIGSIEARSWLSTQPVKPRCSFASKLPQAPPEGVGGGRTGRLSFSPSLSISSSSSSSSLCALVCVRIHVCCVCVFLCLSLVSRCPCLASVYVCDFMCTCICLSLCLPCSLHPSSGLLCPLGVMPLQHVNPLLSQAHSLTRLLLLSPV